MVSLFLLSCSTPEQKEVGLWYDKPAEKWADAFPLGNGRMAAMCYGGTDTSRFQLNEESLWAGTQINPVPENYFENLKKIQELVMAGKFAEAHDFGVENLTVRPTSFRSYEPLCDLLIDLNMAGTVSDYRRELDMVSGISRVEYLSGETKIIQESFISAEDDVLCVRITSAGKEKLNAGLALSRFKDASFSVSPDGRIHMDGQIVDIEAPDAFDDNAGGSGPGGAHMRFAGRLAVKSKGGQVIPEGQVLRISDTDEILVVFTAATDYNLEKLDFDPSVDPGKKADQILAAAQQKTWDQIKSAHVSEHSKVFNRVSLDLGPSSKDTIPLDKRLAAFGEGAEDNDLMVELFQFGRYLLMGSSRNPAILPANLQGKWNERKWAPWEADYHLNVNLQMNYWPSDVTNLSETNQPLINWFSALTNLSRPLAKEMYGSDGWFACLATNPLGRFTPSASTPESQFINGVLDPLAGAWMVMNLWDHYEFTGDEDFLKNELFPLLSGASRFILDVLIPDQEGKLHFVPSASPENAFIDQETGRQIRITATSTYHLSVIRAVFEATLEAAEILGTTEQICEEIKTVQQKLPDFPIDGNGRLMEWQDVKVENEPGHRHLSHLLGLHPFALFTPETPDLYESARKSLDWRQENGQGGGGWAAAHAMLMYAWLYEGEEAVQSLRSLVTSGMETNLLNARSIFQIDGNFGATAGMAEMLIQSHRKDNNGNYMVHLLPALPAAWPSGSVSGLRTRGGFSVDITWENQAIKTAVISSSKGGTCTILYHGKTLEITLKPGESRELGKMI